MLRQKPKAYATVIFLIATNPHHIPTNHSFYSVIRWPRLQRHSVRQRLQRSPRVATLTPRDASRDNSRLPAHICQKAPSRVGSGESRILDLVNHPIDAGHCNPSMTNQDPPLYVLSAPRPPSNGCRPFRPRATSTRLFTTRYSFCTASVRNRRQFEFFVASTCHISTYL